MLHVQTHDSIKQSLKTQSSVLIKRKLGMALHKLWLHTGINSSAKRMLCLCTVGLHGPTRVCLIQCKISLHFLFTVVPPKSRFAIVLFSRVLSRFAYVPVLLSPHQFQRERDICMSIMAERTGYTHSQRSFSLLKRNDIRRPRLGC